MSEETILQSKVPANQIGQSLLKYLSERFRYQTPEAWKELILAGKVTINSLPSQPDQLLQKSDVMAYSVILREPEVNRDIRMVHEEETFLVASKSGQLPSHADGNYIKNTFIYILGQRLLERGWKGKLNLVHRLDRETSGLMVVAKNSVAHKSLVAQFESGTIDKEYMAIVKGVVEQEKWEVAGSIGKDTESQISIRQRVVPDGTPYSKPSLTLFEKVAALGNFTLVRCIPKTGRTNQIRVHLDSIGHPIVGDKLYGRTDKQFLDFIHHVKAGGDVSFSETMEAPRQFLHASKLSFSHPRTNNRLTFTDPLPPDMEAFFQKYS